MWTTRDKSASPQLPAGIHEGDQNGSPSSASGTKSKPKFQATKEELKARLSPIQYQVTQLKSTERSVFKIK